MIAAVVLAAGKGTRFGGDKVLARWRGTALVRHVVDGLRQAGVDAVVVVCGGSEAGVRGALTGTGARLAVNPRPGDGLSASLRAGVSALPDEIEAFVVSLGDQPGVDPGVVGALVREWRHSGADAVVPEYRDGRGNPVLFHARMRTRLTQLSGDVGARALLASLGDRVVGVTVDAPAPRDVDTTDDLRLLDG